MRINPLSTFKTQNIYKQSINNEPKQTEEKELPLSYVSNYNNISFQAARGVLRKPMMKTEELQNLADKLSSVLKTLPENCVVNSKTPLKVPFANGVVAFVIDKTHAERSQIHIKLKENSTKIKDWDSIQEFDKGMSLILNKKGQMVEGVYYETGGCHIFFRRMPKNLRRIIYKHNQYVPENIEKYSWKRVAAGEHIFSTHEHIDVDAEKFEALFFEMAEPWTTLIEKNH